MRLDKHLVKIGACETRTRAQELILSGGVLVNGQIITKSSYDIGPEDKITTKPLPQHSYVARSGYKLEKAIEHLSLDVSGFTVFDIGQSTGGFTDCLVKKKVKQVIGIDVGVDQLHPSMSSNPNVIYYEKTNVKDLHEFLKKHQYQNIFNFMVCDISFISIKAMTPFIKQILGPSGHGLILVKPQFELGAEALNSNGVVKDPELYKKLEENIKNHLEELGHKVLDYFPSELEGKSGNKEFFVYVK